MMIDEKEKKGNKQELKKKVRRIALRDLRDLFKRKMFEDFDEDEELKETLPKQRMQVTISAPDKEGLEEGLSKAQQIMEKMEKFEKLKDKDDDEEIDDRDRFMIKDWD